MNQGSGRADLEVLIPVAQIDVQPDKWFLLYSEMGFEPGYETDGGFDEWKVKLHPTITIIKDSIPDDDADFDFTTTGAGLINFTLDDEGSEGDIVCTGGDCLSSQTFTLDPGTFTVTETVTAGWELTGLSCDVEGRNTSASILGTQVTIILDDVDGHVTCTYTNTAKGTIIIRKQTDPNGASGSFGYSTTGGRSPATFNLLDDGVRTYLDVSTGSYSVTENSPTPGFDLTGIDCSATTGADTSASGNTGTRITTITLAPGGTVDCTYNNRQRGTITIIKDADPDDAQDFAYTVGGANPSGLSGFSLDDDGVNTGTGGDIKNTKVFTNVLPGGYTVTEGDPTALTPAWDLTDLSCIVTGGASGSQDGSNDLKANITLTAGGSVTCTYTNTKRGIIEIKKVTKNNGTIVFDTQDFTFTGTGPGVVGNQPFFLDTLNGTDDERSDSKTFSDLEAGKVYSITEFAVGSNTSASDATWHLTNISCTRSLSSSGLAFGTNGGGFNNGGNDNFALGETTVQITLAPGEKVTCTFTNKQNLGLVLFTCDLFDDSLISSIYDLDGSSGDATFGTITSVTSLPLQSEGGGDDFTASAAELEAYICANLMQYTGLDDRTHTGVLVNVLNP